MGFPHSRNTLQQIDTAQELCAERNICRRWKRLSNYNTENLYSSRNIIVMTISKNERRMRCLGEEENAYCCFTRNP